MRHQKDALRLKLQLLVGMAGGFLLVVMIGVASADGQPSSDPAMPVELAPAVVVAAGADSVNTSAVARLSVETSSGVEQGTAFQLGDGRLATVAHALVDARSAQVDGVDVPLDNGLITRQHDLGSIAAVVLDGELSASDEPGVVGQLVALGGFGRDGRLEIINGEIISRTSGAGYGIGRPDVYVISATVETGWSGGPVVDSNGDVLAVIVGVETRSGVTLAVPIEYLPAVSR